LLSLPCRLTPSTLANNISMLLFATLGYVTIVRYFGLAVLGKYYLAPLVVFHLWQRCVRRGPIALPAMWFAMVI